MEQATLYLQKLRFDENLKKSFIAKYFSNPRLVFLVIISIIAIGISSYISLPRQLNPEVQFPIIIVTTVLPGANPQDIESLITEPIESSVNTLEDVKTVASTSQDNLSVVQIEFESDANTDAARTDVQTAIDQVNLPEDAQSPNVTDIDFENQPVWSFAVTGPDYASLARFSESLKKNLENQSSIRSVEVSGLETQEVAVTIPPDRLAAYGISPPQISQLIQSASGSIPAGTISTTTNNFSLSIDPSITTIDDIRNLQINVNGSIIPLSAIATIEYTSKPNQAQSFYADNNTPHTQSVTIDVFKSRSANIDTAVLQTQQEIDAITQQYGELFDIKTITNTGDLIDEQFNDLLRDFSITIVLVFLTLFIFLGARQAFVAFIAVPFTFLIAFTAMRLTGISLNFLSMFSLLLSLGLLVDDTIVVISAMSSYFRSGKFTPLQTGLLVWRDFGIAIVTTTLTTVFAFFPLLLSTGIIGEFIKSIPIVVSSTLLASLFIGLFVTLPLMIILLKPTIPNRVRILFRIVLAIGFAVLYFTVTPKGEFFIIEIFAFFIFLFVLLITRNQFLSGIKLGFSKRKNKKGSFTNRTVRYSDTGVISFSRIESVYRRILRRIITSRVNRRNAITMVLIFSIFSYLLLPLGFVKNEFFPKSDQEFLYVTLELPSGTNISTSRTTAINLLEELRTIPEVEYVITDIGRAFSTTGISPSGENTVLYSLVLPPKSEREKTSIEIADNLRNKYSVYAPGEITVAEVSGGPPAGADIQIKLFGEEYSELQMYSDRVVDFLESNEGATDVQKSINPGASKIVFAPDLQKLALYNLTQEQLGLWLRSYASGFSLDTIKFSENGNDNTDLTLRLSTENPQVEDIFALSIPTQQGIIPLANLGTLDLQQNPTLISREDGQRTISITATARPGASITEIGQELGDYADNELNLPDGYSWSTGGVNEENQQSVNSILLAMVLSFLLITVTMVVQFGSFRKAAIVMLVIPLSISGVFIIFGLLQIPLSFPALIGILALFGIVVKNSILIVDKITANQKVGMSFTDSIIDGSVSRLEAIALTSLTAIFGLIPITLSDPLWRGLGGAIIAGLTFSGTIMLFFIPVVYYYWFNPRARGKGEAVRVKRQTSLKR